jgi:hypothetical protein
MVFKFRILYERRYKNLIGEIIHTDKRSERIKVSGRNRSIVIQSNRPLLLSKGLKHRRIDWKIVEGDMNSPFVFGLICEEIERFFKKQEK